MADRPPPVVRATVEARGQYAAYKQELRHDFWYACAYCSLAESESKAVGFQIDHYHPQSLRPDLMSTYSNLYWSCIFCNLNKTGYPAKSGPISDEHRFIKVDEEHPASHMRLEGERMKDLSTTGRFNIEVLLLNGSVLRDIRADRERLWKSREVCAWGLQELRKVSVDQLPGNQRIKFARLLQQLEETNEKVSASLEKFIRERNRSPLLDPDPDHKQALEQRKAYLREERAISLDNMKVKKKSSTAER